ncbi:MAG: hypothetical protein ACTSXL_00440 [Alphaproteobacteria bacterium]
MIRYIMVLFLGITMTYAPADARRSGERTSSSKTSKAKKQTSRRGKGGNRRATNARTAKITVASEVVEGIDLTTETEVAETIGTTDVLQEQVNTVKKEINAIEQCVVTLCDAGTDEESTKMALCSDNYKKKKLEKREKELREKEDKVRITLADLPKVKLSTAERKIYDSIEAPEKEENDLGDDDMNFDDLMGSIADMSDALDGEGAKRRITGSVLLTKAVDLCAKKFPNIIDDKQNFIDLMTVRADNSANALGEHYDKKAYKLNVAFDMAMKKLRMASVDKHRDNLDTDSCVKGILAKAQGIYGTDFEELAKCDDLTSDCSAKNFAQFEDSKKAFATTLDSCKDGAGAWEIALLKIKRTLEQSAKTEIFDSKSKSVEQLAETRQVCLSEMKDCLENLSGAEVGYISFLSADPFNSSKKSSSLSLYKDTDDKKANNIFEQMSEQYGMKITRLSRKETQKICVPYIDKCRSKLELLSQDPSLSKEMLDSNLSEDDLFKQSYMKIQFLADKKWVENEGKILTERLGVIKKQRAVQLAMIKGEYDVKTKKTTAKQKYELTKLKGENDQVIAKQNLEVAKIRSEYDVKNKKLDAKYDYDEEKMRRETQNAEMKTKNTMRLDYSKVRLFNKTFCGQFGGTFNETMDSIGGKDSDGNQVSEEVAIGGSSCIFEARGRKMAGKKANREFTETVRLTDSGSTVVRCEKGFFKRAPKKGCRVAQGPNFDYKMQCKIPSFSELLSYAQAGGEGLPASGMCLWGAGDINVARRKLIKIAKIAAVGTLAVAATVATGGFGGAAIGTALSIGTTGGAIVGSTIVGATGIAATAATIGNESDSSRSKKKAARKAKKAAKNK